MRIDFEILKKIKPDTWNERVESLPEGTWRQSTYVAQLRSKTWRDRPSFILARNDKGDIVAQCLVFSNFSSPAHLLRQPQGLFSGLTLPVAERFLKAYNWRYGPLVFDRKNYLQILDKFLKFIDALVKKDGYQIRDIHPPIHNLEIQQEDIKDIYIANGYTAKEWGTVLINLQEDLDKLRSRMKKGSRYDIKKAVRDGVKIIEIKDMAGIKEYYHLLHEWAVRNHLDKPIFYVLEKNWRYLKSSDKGKFLLAKHNGRIVAGLGITYFNGVIFQGGIATSNYASKERLFGNHLLNWYVMKLGQKRGFRFFDLTWIDPDPKTVREKNIFKFKTRWGGDIIKYSVYTKTVSAGKDKTFRFLKKIYRRPRFS